MLCLRVLSFLVVLAAASCSNEPDDEGSKGGDFNSDSSDSADANEVCGADADQQIKLCPDNGARDSMVLHCVDTYERFASMGCGDEWLDYVGCTAEATYNCEDGPLSCEATQTPYFACQSSFTTRTGCTRIESLDKRCATARPQGFGCIGSALPPNCESIPDAAGACCSAF